MTPGGAKLLGMDEATLEAVAMPTPGGGCSRIYGPDGRCLAGSEMKPSEEGLVIHDLDLSDVTAAKTLLDGVGHYSRPDLLKLQVNSETRQVVESTSGPVPALSKYVSLD